MTAGWGGARPGSGRRRVELLRLVESASFDRRRVAHRRELCEGDLSGLPDGKTRERLCALQSTYQAWLGVSQAASSHAAKLFELAVKEEFGD